MSKFSTVAEADTILREDREIGTDGFHKQYVGVKLTIIERHGLVLTEVGLKDGNLIKNGRRDIHPHPKPILALAAAIEAVERRVAEFRSEFEAMQKAKAGQVQKQSNVQLATAAEIEPDPYEVPEA